MLGITSTGQFGLLYNVNQEGAGSGLNTTLASPTPFTVYFYNSSDVLLFSSGHNPGQTAFPPALDNGEGAFVEW